MKGVSSNANAQCCINAYNAVITIHSSTINHGPCTIRLTLTQQYKHVGVGTADHGTARAVVHVQTTVGQQATYLVGCE